MTIPTVESLCEINSESLGPDTPADFAFDYIDISSVTGGHVSRDSVRRLTYKYAPSRARRRLRFGDVLLCTVRPGLQSHTRIVQENGTPLVGSTGFAVLRPIEPSDSSFVFHQLFSNEVASQLRAMETGSNYPAVNERDVARLKIFAPNFKERSRIGAMLDTVHASIAKSAAVIAKLKQVRAGLLHDLLTNGIDDNGELRDPITHPQKFVDSLLGRIVSGWRITAISSAALEAPGSITIGPFGSNLVTSDYGDMGVPVVFVRDVKPGQFEWKSKVYIAASKARELAAHSVHPGDVIATKMGLPPCLACVYPDSMPPGVITADIIRIRVDTSAAIPEWTAAYLNSEVVARQIRAITGGVTRPKVTVREFRNVLIALPLPQEQRRIIQVLESHTQRVQNEEIRREKLTMIKAGLMSDLLTGRVRVPQTIETGAQ